jgi:hypothetical protein
MIKVIDNFFQDPYFVKREAFKSKLKDNYLTHPGMRCVIPKNIEDLVLHSLKKELNEDVRIVECGFDFIDKRYVTGIPHSDSGRNGYDGFKYSAVIYLNENPPKNTGIEIYDCAKNNRHLYFHTENAENLKEGFFASKKTFIDQFIWKNFIVKRCMSGLKNKIEVSKKFNRMVVFDSDRIHRPQNYFGPNKENCRLSMIFFLK